MDETRRVTLSGICFELPDPSEDLPPATKEENLAKAVRLLEVAADRGTDLALLPELFATKRTRLQGREAAEPAPGGDIAEAMAEVARRRRMYVAAPMYDRRDDGVYNSVVLFDRAGAVAGRFDKVHLPPGEEAVAVPGRGWQVVETDFGRVGGLICYDLNFPEAARCLALMGAEVLLWPTMFSQPRAHYTDVLMRARALENQLFLVAANYAQRCLDPRGVHIGRGAVLDWDGQVVADTGRREGVATAVVDLGERRAVYGVAEDLLAARRPETYGPLVEREG